MSENATEKKPDAKKTPRRHRGISVVIVVILGAIGMAIVGTVFHMTTTSSGLARTTSASVAKYNLLQNALERGKRVLKKSMDNTNAPLRYFDKYPDYNGNGPDEADALHTLTGGKIKECDVLVISQDLNITGETGNWSNGRWWRPLTSNELASIGQPGGAGILEWTIYDMQYTPANIAGDITAANLQKIPPSIVLKVGRKTEPEFGQVNEPEPGATGSARNTGVYLIRAQIDAGGFIDTMETAIYQSNNM
jgi:hypothetical protein